MRPTQSLLLAFVVILITGLPGRPAAARDNTFKAVIRGLESEYKLKPKRVPGMWLAKCILKVAHPPGVSKLQLALFDDPDLEGRAAAPDLGARIQAMLGAGWRQFVHVDAPKQQERVLLFARPHGRRMELFVLALEDEEGVALFARVHPEMFHRMVEDPTSAFPGKH